MIVERSFVCRWHCSCGATTETAASAEFASWQEPDCEDEQAEARLSAPRPAGWTPMGCQVCSAEWAPSTLPPE